MTTAMRYARRVATFGRRWGLAVVLGGGLGLLHVVLALDPLAGALGPILGGVLASLSGIGLGLLVAVFAALMVRLAARPAADG